MLSCRCPFMFSSWVLNGSTFCISAVRLSLPVYIVISSTPPKNFLPAKRSSCPPQESFFSANPALRSADPPTHTPPAPIPKPFPKSWETGYASSVAPKSSVTDVLRPVQSTAPVRGGGEGMGGGGARKAFSSPQPTSPQDSGARLRRPAAVPPLCR